MGGVSTRDFGSREDAAVVDLETGGDSPDSHTAMGLLKGQVQLLGDIQDAIDENNDHLVDVIAGVGSEAPARGARTVAKSDTTVVNCRALYVGGAGDVAIIAIDDSTAVTLPSVPAGTLLPIACKKIMSTNTTATNMVALF